MSQNTEPFDPAQHTVDEVEAYLDGVDAQERERVLALESSEGGKQRTTLTEGKYAQQSTPTDNDNPDPAPGEQPAPGQTTGDVDPTSDPADPDNEGDSPTTYGGETTPSKPVWNVQTHGKVPEARRDLYHVIGE